MAQHGGKRKRAGRPRGKVSKLAIDIRELSIPHAQTAIDTLLDVMMKADTDAARVSAAKELLDRAFGKSRQALDVSADEKLGDLITRLWAK